MPKGKFYSKEERNFILSNQDKLSIQQIAEHLGRSVGSVSGY